MYILFINSGDKCDIFVSTQFNNYNNKKICLTHEFNLASPNPCWVGWTYVMGWVGLDFFLLTMVGWVKKSP